MPLAGEAAAIAAGTAGAVTLVAAWLVWRDAFAATLNVASDIPARQRAMANKLRGVTKPALEEGFFFIFEVLPGLRLTFDFTVSGRELFHVLSFDSSDWATSDASRADKA